MKLDDYFDFLDSNSDIRIKGSRIGIESVLYEYVHLHKSPEEIAARFDTITLEQVYATILYYLHNHQDVSRYLDDWIEWGRKMRAEQASRPINSEFASRMRHAAKAMSDRGQAAS
jgi:uncharacterized protein (DUF433 family)